MGRRADPGCSYVRPALTPADARLIIDALETVAHDMAAHTHTQAPYLLRQEDFAEWPLAQRLRKMLMRAEADRARRGL